MNESIDSGETVTPSPFLPILLVELSVLFFFVFLCADQSAQRAKFQEAFRQRETVAQQSAQVQAKVQKIIEEFADAAPNESQAVFSKYGIQVNPKGPAPSPAP